MKSFYAFFIAALLAIPAMTASAITIDGVAETAYGSAVSTQALGTSALDNNIATNIGIANGSELDAAYGFVSNGVLYLTIAGNFDSSFGFSAYDTLHTFFMADDGAGGDHILTGLYNGTFNGRINNMLGMTFDTAFTANYWIGVNAGQNNATTNPVTMYVDYVVICSNCPSAFLGNVDLPIAQPAAILTNIYFGNVMQFAMDNSNTGGVTSTTCTTNTQGAAQSVAASAVRSGIEMAIPLATIGSPTGTVRICAFLTEQTMTYMFNQALGPFDGGVPYCLDTLDGATTLTSFFDFNTYPGQQYFTFAVPPCDVIKVNPTTADYTSTGGVGSVTALNSGGCAITVTASTNWLSVTSTPGLGSGNGFFTYSVASNANTIQTRTGQFFIKNTEPSGNIVTQIVTITQSGVPSPALSTIFEIDGIAEAAYGCPLTVQQIQTGFGNSTGTNLISNGGGSELDAAYGMINDGILFLVFAGNLENNGNKIDIFLMTGPGGQNTLSNANPNVANLNNMATSTNGLTFHTGFAPNYLISANVGGGTFFVDYAQLVQGGTNSGAVGYFLGSTTITNGTLIGGTNPFGIQATINDSNTNGVDGANPGCLINGSSQVEADLAAPVRTGIELGIPLGALGSPTGAIAVVAFVNNGGQTFMSNQMLPSLVTNACQANLGSGPNNTPTINLNSFAGEASFLVGPEMRITSISRVATNIVLSYQTAASTNLTYQLQRTSALTTNTTWSNVAGLQLGTGGVISQTIFNAATNSAQFYRVRQTPLCP